MSDDVEVTEIRNYKAYRVHDALRDLADDLEATEGDQVLIGLWHLPSEGDPLDGDVVLQAVLTSMAAAPPTVGDQPEVERDG